MIDAFSIITTTFHSSPPPRRYCCGRRRPTLRHEQHTQLTKVWGIHHPDDSNSYYPTTTTRTSNDDSDNHYEYDFYENDSSNNNNNYYNNNINNPYDDSTSILDSTITPLLQSPPIPEQRPIRRTTSPPLPTTTRTTAFDWSYDSTNDPNDMDKYDDDDTDSTIADNYEYLEESVSSSSLPGNFWMNPILDEYDDMDDTVTIPSSSISSSISPPTSRFSKERRNRRTQSQSPRASTSSSSSSSNRRERRKATTTANTSTSSRVKMGNTQPSPPSPLLELYQRLFWYGLEEDDINRNRNNNNNNNDDDDESDENTSDRRSTMFGGTKGKFNGLAFLYDSIGTVPLQEQRPKRSFNQRTRPIFDEDDMNNDTTDTDTDFDYNHNDDDDRYENESTLRRRRRRVPPEMQSASSSSSASSSLPPPIPVPGTRSKFVPVTPPYDPPLVPPSTQRHGRMINDDRETATPVSQSRRRRRISNLEPSLQQQQQEQPRRRRSSSNGMNSNDWVVRTVDSWFSPSKDNDDADYVATGNDYVEFDRYPTNGIPRQSSKRRNRRDNNVKYYDYNDGDDDDDDDDAGNTVSAAPGSTIIQPIAKAFETFLGLDREVLQNEADTYNRQMGLRVASSNVPFVGVNSQEPQERSYSDDVNRNNGDNDNMIDNTEKEAEVKPLSWEERASAMERVPPIGVTAWGTDGVIDECDARTKAFQDAMMDVQLVQEQIRHCQKQIVTLQDEMSLLHMDIKLGKHQLQKLKQQSQNQNAANAIAILKKMTVQLRQMEKRLNSVNYEIRYKRLQKRNMIRDYHVLVRRRHWAIFQTMKHVTMDETILSEPTKEAFQELEMNEPAVRRFSSKQRKDSQSP